MVPRADRWLPLRGLALVLMTFLIGGCATAYQPPQGIVWVYTGTSQSVASLQVLAYAPTKDSCEISLAKDRYTVPRTAAWADMTLSGCQQATIGPGNSYWAFALTSHGMGIGTATLELCEKMRDGLKRSYSTSTCAPISVQFRGK